MGCTWFGVDAFYGWHEDFNERVKAIQKERVSGTMLLVIALKISLSMAPLVDIG